MARKAKTLENMEKNLTKEEIAAREQAEAALLEGAAPLDAKKPPALIAGDEVACAYWRNIILRAQDVLVMDSLDTEMLAIYCSQMSRLRSMLADYTPGQEKNIQKIEKSLLGYAKELGLTPTARAGIAKKRAAQAVDDPTADLFG